MINYSRTFEINFHKLFEDKQAEIERVNAQIDEAGGAEVKDLEKKIKRNEKKYDKKEEYLSFSQANFSV